MQRIPSRSQSLKYSETAQNIHKSLKLKFWIGLIHLIGKPLPTAESFEKLQQDVKGNELLEIVMVYLLDCRAKVIPRPLEVLFWLICIPEHPAYWIRDKRVQRVLSGTPHSATMARTNQETKYSVWSSNELDTTQVSDDYSKATDINNSQHGFLTRNEG